MIIEKLSKNHKREDFDCGNNFLNDFLKSMLIKIRLDI